MNATTTVLEHSKPLVVDGVTVSSDISVARVGG